MAALTLATDEERAPRGPELRLLIAQSGSAGSRARTQSSATSARLERW
jgi:hypothetical protein